MEIMLFTHLADNIDKYRSIFGCLRVNKPEEPSWMAEVWTLLPRAQAWSRAAEMPIGTERGGRKGLDAAFTRRKRPSPFRL